MITTKDIYDASSFDEKIILLAKMNNTDPFLWNFSTYGYCGVLELARHVASDKEFSLVDIFFVLEELVSMTKEEKIRVKVLKMILGIPLEECLTSPISFVRDAKIFFERYLSESRRDDRRIL